jgi:predicted acylesterase/phospholipase RssA
MRRLLLLLTFTASLTLATPAICDDVAPPASPKPVAPAPVPATPAPAEPSSSSASEPTKPAPSPPPASPSPPSAPTPAVPPILGLTVSGGVSLGAFEAGYLYYLFETLKLNPGLAEPRIFTGASAGSANALLSLLASCTGREPRPDHSLFYRTWIPVGLKQLFDPDKVSRRALFSQDALRETLDSIGEVWNQGMAASCDATLGLSTTRVTAAKVELIKDRVTLARTEAKFVVRVRGRGPGKPPLITNYVGERELLSRPLLPAESSGGVGFESLKQVMLASSAFPLAFEPVPVPHCTAHAGEGGLICTQDRAEISLFMDGGVFDNQPLRLAVQLAQQGLVGTGPSRHFADAPSRVLRSLRDDLLFVYVDPAVEVLPTVDAAEGPSDDSTVSYLLYLFEQLVESSRSKELQVLLEDDPDVTKQITATHTYFMPLSDPLYSFMGFFEKNFRVHDYYLGMHSAHRWFAEIVQGWRADADPLYPEEAYTQVHDVPLTKSWAPYRCMRAAFDGEGSMAVCNEVDASLRAGIQTSLDRIYARCAQLAHKLEGEGKTVPPTTHQHCRRAFMGERPPLLPGMKSNQGFEFKDDTESDLDHELRRLATHGFRFRDMGIPHERASEAKRFVAQRIGMLVRALAEQQKVGVYRAVLPVVGRLASQAMAYVPPYATYHLLMGRGLEAGYSGALWDSKFKWLRGALSLELDGMLTLVSRGNSNALKLTPMAGIELELVRLSSWQYQTRIGLRGGFAFSTGDHFLSLSCKDGEACSRARGEAYLALIMYQLLRLQLGFAAYPPMHDLPWDYSIQPRIGLELDRP